jgi:N-methylhydantoinase B
MRHCGREEHDTMEQPVQIDPITFAVIKSGLDSIVDEMAYTVVRTARSEIVKDVMDFSAALCAGDGQMIAQAKTIALHLGAVPEAMASVLVKFEGDLNTGDVVIMNDPYSGGMHLPDIFMFMPIFHGGRRRAFAVVIAHHTDMGGRVPGSNASDSTEIFQEGLRLPPVKLFEGGRHNRTLFDLIDRNVRVPERVIGDLGAQVAACKVGERELSKLFEQYGGDTTAAYLSELLDYAERMTREEIRSWPRGTFTFTDHIDDDGMSKDPVPIKVAVTIGDGHLTVDYAGSAAQVRAAINATLSYTKSCTYLSVRCLLRGDVPNNAGVFRCVTVTAPERSVLNVAHPGACAARALTGYRVVDTLFGAFAQAVPDRVPAAGEGGNSVVCLGGYNPDQTPFIIVDMICGAWGGRPDKDGIDAVTNPSQNLSNTPVEVLEAQHPVRIEEYALVPDSCGAGRYRGGLGIAREYTLLGSQALLQLRSDRLKFPPYGLAGGRPGRPTRNILNPQRNARVMPSKFTLTLETGEVIRHEQAGGGGHGDPLERDPERVAADVQDEKITLEFATNEHGVIIDPATLDVDAERTRSRRAAMAAARCGS